MLAKRTYFLGLLRHMVATVLLAVPGASWTAGNTLNIGGTSLELLENCDSEHKLNVLVGDRVLCAPATTNAQTNTLHVLYNDTVYSICNGECATGGYVMPETPPDPIVMDSSCEWTQTNPNAYLLSDGNQYFDTGVTLDSTVAMDLTMEIVNGVNARLFGTDGAGGCYYDMTINASGDIYFRVGASSYSSIANSGTVATGKHLWEIKNNNTNGTAKYIYQDGKRVAYKAASQCTGTSTILVFKGTYISTLDYTNNGGMKLYSIKMYNKSGKLLHDYQPVASGTDICGYTAPANAMWDFVTKKLYLPAGTGQMGYGVDS